MYFYNNGKPVIYTGSADLMERNFDRRVEILYPIENSAIKEDIIELLKLYLNDNVKTRVLKSDGTYYRKRAGEFVIKSGRNLHKNDDLINIQEYFVNKVKKQHLDEIKKEHRKKIKKQKLKKVKLN